MAFWGAEVKPRKSFTLKFSDFEGPRLHLSQVTLGNRKSDDRTILKCRVGNSPAVYLCSLLPGTFETCTLDLYFDEDVTFHVKGSSSVHLAGYFDGTFDGDESGEDVEDDGYSDEEEEEDSERGSMDAFLVSGDDDDYVNGEWSSEEDVPTRVRKSGVTIEELPDEPSVKDSKSKIAHEETGLVPHKGVLKKSKHKGSNGLTKGLVEHHEDTNGDVSQKQESVVITDDNHSSGSEDEDGFLVKRKRKFKDGGNEQPSKKMSTDSPVITPAVGHDTDMIAPVSAPAAGHEMNTESKESSKMKKKKKKKKKSKNSSEDASTSMQVNGSLEGPVKPGKNSPVDAPTSIQGNGSLKTPDSKFAPTSSEHHVDKKGTVRKYPNGLEIENMLIGKPDGKQATPGKKVGVIYTGKLRSNGKIFDSNVGKKPFFFRLGVGEVIKGWDVGVNGMRIGDKRQLTIPPNMAYGSKGLPGIPPNSWLMFIVELVEVK